MKDEIDIRTGSRWWYLGLIPVFMAGLWGIWVTQPQFAPRSEPLDSMGPPISGHRFDEPWLNSIAMAYDDAAIDPAEFKDCYQRLRDAALDDHEHEFVCDLFRRKKFAPNLVREIQKTPREDRFGLFRAHSFYPRCLEAKYELARLLESKLAGAQLTAAEKEHVTQIAIELQDFDRHLENRDVVPYLWSGYNETLENTIRDAHEILGSPLGDAADAAH